MLSFFFFQAEDGIRDHCVTGVQTCALPILRNLAKRKRQQSSKDFSLVILRRHSSVRPLFYHTVRISLSGSVVAGVFAQSVLVVAWRTRSPLSTYATA